MMDVVCIHRQSFFLEAQRLCVLRGDDDDAIDLA